MKEIEIPIPGLTTEEHFEAVLDACAEVRRQRAEQRRQAMHVVKDAKKVAE